MRRLALALLLALAACLPAPPKERVQPALWEVTGANGERGWLFGTIHALPEPVDWNSAAVDKSLANADRLILEIAAIDDEAALKATYARLAASRGLPPLLDRLPPQDRAGAARLLREEGIAPDQFGETETWAIALTLARQLSQETEAIYGIDRELLAAAKGMPVGELEGAEAQLGIFDRLPESEQRDLLRLTFAEAGNADAEADRLAEAWGSGDMARLEAETRTGLLADPELREALLVARNRAWTDKLARMLAAGGKPFVAVGAAHMAGPDGLPAMLALKGYTVVRLQ